MGSAEADSFWLNTWIDGFKESQSLNEKKFSQEDLKQAIKLGRKGYDEFNENGFIRHGFDFTEEQILQSLSKPKEYNVEVEMGIIRQNQCINKCASYPSACLCEMTKQPKII